MSEASTATSRLIGAIFVERGLVTAEQLERALELQQRSGERLGEVLVNHFGVSRLDLASVLSEQWSEHDRAPNAVVPEVSAGPTADAAPAPSVLEQVEREVEASDMRPIGEIFVDHGFVSADELERALAVQRETGQRLGEALVSQGSITRLELASALAEQWAGVQKLRPPAPLDAEAGAAPATGPLRPPVSVQHPAAAAAEMDELRGELDRLRDSLDELRADLAGVATEEAVGHGLAEVRRELDELAARTSGDLALDTRVAELALRLDGLMPPPEIDLASIHAELFTLREAVRALEQRPAAAPEVEAVAHRLDAVEARLSDGTEQHRLRTAVAELQAEVAALGKEERARVDAVVERLLELEMRLPHPAVLEELTRDVAGLLARPERDARIEQRLDELSAALQELAGRPGVSADESLPSRLAEVERRVAETASEQDVRQAFDAVQAEMRDVAARLAMLPGELAAGGELEELRASLAELAARPAGDPALAARVDELAAPLEDVAALRAGLDELRQALAEQAAALTGIRQDDTLASRLAELERGLAEAAPAQDVREAFDAVREELREAAARLEEVPESGELRGELDELRSAVAELDELRSAVAELAARPVDDPEVVLRLEALAERIDDVTALPAELDALRLSVRELAAAQKPGQDDELALRLLDIEQRLADGSETEELRASLAALQAAVAGLSRGDDQARFDAVHARVDQLEQRLGDPSALDPLRADLAALRAQLNALSDEVAAGSLEQLRVRIEELERGLAGAASRDELGNQLQTLGARVDQLGRRAADSDSLDALRADVDALAARPAGDPELAARLDELGARVDELAAGAAQAHEVEELRSTLARLEERAAGDSSVAERVDDLARRADAWDASAGSLAELREAVVEVESRPQPDPELPERVAQLAAELHALGGTTAMRADLDALRDSIARLEARPEPDPDLPARLGALGHRVDLLEPASSRLDELVSRVEELSARPAGDPTLPPRLEAVERRLEESAGLADAVHRLGKEVARARAEAEDARGLLARRTGELEQALHARLDEAIAEWRAAAEQLGDRLAAAGNDLDEVRSSSTRAAAAVEEALRERLEETFAEIRIAAETAGAELREQLEALRRDRESSEATLAAALEEAASTARAGHERLAAEMEELATEAGRRDEQLRGLSRELGFRLDELSARTPADEEARAGVAELHAALGALRASLQELALERANDAEQAAAMAAELGARLDEVALDVAARQATAATELREELAELAGRLEELHAAGVKAGDELRTALEQARTSVGWRLEQVEQALAGDDRDELRRALAELRARQRAYDEQQAEQVRVTERALRKGLASLGERLADSEAEYVKAGNALRRSIERLGSAIVEADVAATERGAPEALSLHHAHATSYVAFAPTPDGYRLVAVDGAPPELGERVELPQCDGELVVTRIGPSPIPLDTRPCAYLERAAVATLTE